MVQKHRTHRPYILLTPGPLTTSPTVKEAMLKDWCTWDDEYKELVQHIRTRLVQLATKAPGYTCVLMQGSGTFCVESVITTVVPAGGKLLVLANGAYGRRMASIAKRIKIDHCLLDSGDIALPDLGALDRQLVTDGTITHVAAVHCETTTGMLNPIEEIGRIVSARGRVFIVDAMSSFGGIPLDVERCNADFLISSANKCVQGVPGFGFVIARSRILAATAGQARSLSLDLHDQWKTMEANRGKWRFTSPTHTVHAFARALQELEAEGGIANRYKRYCDNHQVLVEGMQALGVQPLLAPKLRSPIITAFLCPDDPLWSFDRFYRHLKQRGFVIYPGKLTTVDTFRMGTIGDIDPGDIRRLLSAVAGAIYWRRRNANAGIVSRRSR